MGLYEVLQQFKSWDFSPDNVELVPILSHWWIFDSDTRHKLREQHKRDYFYKKLKEAVTVAKKILDDPNSLQHDKNDTLQLLGLLHLYIHPTDWEEAFPTKNQSIDNAIQYLELASGVERELLYAYNKRIEQLEGTEERKRIGELMFKKGKLLYARGAIEDTITILVEKRKYLSNDLESEALLLSIFAERLEKSEKDYNSRVSKINFQVEGDKNKEINPLERRLEKLGKKPEEPIEPKEKGEMESYERARQEYERDMGWYQHLERKYGGEEALRTAVQEIEDRFASKLKGQMKALRPSEEKIYKQAQELIDQSRLVAGLQRKEEARKTYESLVTILTRIADMHQKTKNIEEEIKYRENLRGLYVILDNPGGTASAHLRLAILYNQNDRNAEAVEACEAAASVYPKGKSNVADVLERIGEKDLAERYRPQKKEEKKG